MGMELVEGAGDANEYREKDVAVGVEVELELNQRVTPEDHWQDVRLLRFRADRDIDYLPGDALEIKPENTTTDVDTLIEHMQWQHIAEKQLILVPNPLRQGTGRFNTPPIPLRPSHDHVTFRDLLTKHLDINSIPRRSFFSAISAHTSDSMHKVASPRIHRPPIRRRILRLRHSTPPKHHRSLPRIRLCQNTLAGNPQRHTSSATTAVQHRQRLQRDEETEAW